MERVNFAEIKKNPVKSKIALSEEVRVDNSVAWYGYPLHDLVIGILYYSQIKVEISDFGQGYVSNRKANICSTLYIVCSFSLETQKQIQQKSKSNFLT